MGTFTKDDLEFLQKCWAFEEKKENAFMRVLIKTFKKWIDIWAPKNDPDVDNQYNRGYLLDSVDEIDCYGIGGEDLTIEKNGVVLHTRLNHDEYDFVDIPFNWFFSDDWIESEKAKKKKYLEKEIKIREANKLDKEERLEKEIKEKQKELNKLKRTSSKMETVLKKSLKDGNSRLTS